jgi:hypothetical protein
MVSFKIFENTNCFRISLIGDYTKTEHFIKNFQSNFQILQIDSNLDNLVEQIDHFVSQRSFDNKAKLLILHIKIPLTETSIKTIEFILKKLKTDTSFLFTTESEKLIPKSLKDRSVVLYVNHTNKTKNQIDTLLNDYKNDDDFMKKIYSLN